MEVRETSKVEKCWSKLSQKMPQSGCREEPFASSLSALCRRLFWGEILGKIAAAAVEKVQRLWWD